MIIALVTTKPASRLRLEPWCVVSSSLTVLEAVVDKSVKDKMAPNMAKKRDGLRALPIELIKRRPHSFWSMVDALLTSNAIAVVKIAITNITAPMISLFKLSFPPWIHFPTVLLFPRGVYTTALPSKSINYKICYNAFRLEGSHSGLVHTLGKRACRQRYRGFESRPLRHSTRRANSQQAVL